MTKPTRKANATRIVVDALMQLLRSGSYAIGDRLPSEWELTRLCSVGRSAVREAIRETVALGLVEVRAGKGSYVRTLRPDLLIQPGAFDDNNVARAAAELLEVRVIFEPEAAALAAIRATDDEIEQIRHDAKMLEEAVAIGFRPPEDLGFHLDVIRAAHNQALLRVGGAIVSFYARDDFMPTAVDVTDHWNIFTAIRGHDAGKARETMREHLVREIDKRAAAFHDVGSLWANRRKHAASS
jgi:GntR family transcriptional repressor for pyruvate dehydrogenase complex